MHDSVPSARYSSVCIVLRLWNTSLIPTYRVGKTLLFLSFLTNIRVDPHEVSVHISNDNCELILCE